MSLTVGLSPWEAYPRYSNIKSVCLFVSSYLSICVFVCAFSILSYVCFRVWMCVSSIDYEIISLYFLFCLFTFLFVFVCVLNRLQAWPFGNWKSIVVCSNKVLLTFCSKFDPVLSLKKVNQSIFVKLQAKRCHANIEIKNYQHLFCNQKRTFQFNFDSFIFNKMIKKIEMAN
jgi:hypothetical protein